MPTFPPSIFVPPRPCVRKATATVALAASMSAVTAAPPRQRTSSRSAVGPGSARSRKYGAATRSACTTSARVLPWRRSRGAIGSGASIARALASRTTIRVARACTTAKPEKIATKPTERTNATEASRLEALREASDREQAYRRRERVEERAPREPAPAGLSLAEHVLDPHEVEVARRPPHRASASGRCRSGRSRCAPRRGCRRRRPRRRAPSRPAVARRCRPRRAPARSATRAARRAPRRELGEHRRSADHHERRELEHDRHDRDARHAQRRDDACASNAAGHRPPRAPRWEARRRAGRDRRAGPGATANSAAAARA